MAITTRHAVNMALQYNNANEVTLTDFQLKDTDPGAKRFLTEAPLIRVLNIDEQSALYILVNDTNFGGYAVYEFYNSAGTLIYLEMLSLNGAGVHNSIPLLSPNFVIPEQAVKLKVYVQDQADQLQVLSLNGDLEEGTGNDFDDWTESGDVVQTASGGLNGTRGAHIADNTVTPGTAMQQASGLSSNTSYRLTIFAKTVDPDFPAKLQMTIDTTAYAPRALTTEYKQYMYEFTTGGTPTDLIKIENNSDVNDGYMAVDHIQLQVVDNQKLSEIRTFLLDRECSPSGEDFQINWLNKLGGRDTFYFKGYPIIGKNVERETLVELSKLQNFVSPKRIFSHREHRSKKSYTLFHRCANRQTAIWLRDELIDSLDVQLLFGEYYYPVIVQDSSLITDNTAEQNPVVSLKFQLAFDVNIQTQ